jgi:hypothetical protein
VVPTGIALSDLPTLITGATGVIGGIGDLFSGGGGGGGGGPGIGGGEVDIPAAIAAGRRTANVPTYDPFTYGQARGGQPGEFSFYKEYGDNAPRVAAPTAGIGTPMRPMVPNTGGNSTRRVAAPAGIGWARAEEEAWRNPLPITMTAENREAAIPVRVADGGPIEAGNIDLNNRPAVRNDDGTPANAWRIARFVGGGAWDTDARSPLAAQGLGVSEGDYLLAINGVPVDGRSNPWKPFLGLAGKSTVITVSKKPSADKDAKDIVVTPIASEDSLRYRDWVESKRRFKLGEAVAG